MYKNFEINRVNELTVVFERPLQMNKIDIACLRQQTRQKNKDGGYQRKQGQPNPNKSDRKILKFEISFHQATPLPTQAPIAPKRIHRCDNPAYRHLH